jgi:short subunit dehydrogenase-like uncharacterized protein
MLRHERLAGSSSPCHSRPVMIQSRSGSTRPDFPDVRIGSRLRPVMPAGTAMPAAPRNVGAKSAKLTKSVTVRPAGTRAGHIIASGTWHPRS